jgi:L-threonylcarbamoyladenylate synthase
MDNEIYPDNIADIIKEGGIGILPTDTLYGIVCSAFLPKSVDRLYEIRKRNPHKKCIVLISDIKDLSNFEIVIDDFTKKVLQTVWPGPVSVEMPAPSDRFEYLHKGTNSLSFRIPDREDLRRFLIKSGPIIVPSANPEGEKPAKTIEEAKNYFPGLDFYINDGILGGDPSTIISIEKNTVNIIRQGKGQIPSEF